MRVTSGGKASQKASSAEADPDHADRLRASPVDVAEASP